jgi:hypothetical protein
MQIYSILLENYLTQYGHATPCVVVPVPTTLVYTLVMTLMMTTYIPHFVVNFLLIIHARAFSEEPLVTCSN